MKRILLFFCTLFLSAMALAAVNINTATKEELDALPGIGPVKAQAILDYRKANGPFKTPEDIMKVSGIKEGEFSKLKGLISVSGATTPPAAPAKAAAPATTAAPATAAAPATTAAPAPAATPAAPAKSDAAKTAAPATTAAAAPAMTEKEKAAADKKAAKEKA
ncbi:MAG TPA: helix-hairpin-helix domain-containing protein, partial [Casimicrobiaceae bacterium]|nr:helix-hairpin-helix domain-containing protein [Casimicrobiaceae bacterium]